MADQYREPIEDNIDLRAKFVGGGESKPISRTKTTASEAKERSSAERDSTYQKMLAQLQTDDDSDDESVYHAHTVARDARAGTDHADVKAQVEHLIELAKVKGVVHAVKVARHMSDYYVLDTMHDKMLADQFFEALNKEGLL